MNKLDMAMQIILAEVRRVGICSIDEDKVKETWFLADAMQAEADKREPKGFPEALQPEVDWESKTTKELKMLIKTLDGILQSRGDCQHEWDHISAYGGSGNYLVCPCGAEKHNL